MMKKFKSLAVGAGLAIALPALASAVTLEGGQFYGDVENSVSAPGSFANGDVLTIRVDLDPVQDLGPWWYPWDLGNKEYTAVVTATVTSVTSNAGGDFVELSNGAVSIYEDASADAACGNAASFTDGTLILSGTISNMMAMRLVQGNPFFPWNVNGTMNFTGGSGLGNLDPQANGNVVMNDAMDPFMLVQSSCNRQIYNTDWKSPTTVSVEPNTWGGVKDLYR